jgi:hypothetical protein
MGHLNQRNLESRRKRLSALPRNARGRELHQGCRRQHPTATIGLCRLLLRGPDIVVYSRFTVPHLTPRSRLLADGSSACWSALGRSRYFMSALSLSLSLPHRGTGQTSTLCGFLNSFGQFALSAYSLCRLSAMGIAAGKIDPRRCQEQEHRGRIEQQRNQPVFSSSAPQDGGQESTHEIRRSYPAPRLHRARYLGSPRGTDRD